MGKDELRQITTNTDNIENKSQKANDHIDAEVIIVGAGPAGIAAAKTLKEHNIDVLVLDKTEFPRRKVCAGGLAYHTTKDFPYIKDFIDTYSRSFIIHSPNLLYSCKITSDDHYMSMTKSRMDFDQKMFELLKGTGCRILTGEDVNGVTVLPTKVTVSTKKGNTYSSLILLGADSALSTIAKCLKIGIFNPKVDRSKKLGLAFEKDWVFDNSKKEDQLALHMILHFKGIRGYAWSFPRSVGTNLGLGGQTYQVKERKDIFPDFEKFCIEREIFPKEAKEGEMHMGLIPNTVPYKDRIVDRVILIGDAGGFCANTTGDGIFYSMTSGTKTSEHIISLINRYKKQASEGAPQEKLNEIFLRKSLMKSNRKLRSAMKELKTHYLISNSLLKNLKFTNKFVRWTSFDNRFAESMLGFLVGKAGPLITMLKILYFLPLLFFKDLLKKMGDPSTDKLLDDGKSIDTANMNIKQDKKECSNH